MSNNSQRRAGKVYLGLICCLGVSQARQKATRYLGVSFASNVYYMDAFAIENGMSVYNSNPC